MKVTVLRDGHSVMAIILKGDMPTGATETAIGILTEIITDIINPFNITGLATVTSTETRVLTINLCNKGEIITRVLTTGRRGLTGNLYNKTGTITRVLTIGAGGPIIIRMTGAVGMITGVEMHVTVRTIVKTGMPTTEQENLKKDCQIVHIMKGAAARQPFL